MLLPPQEREIKELGGVLKALGSPETSGAALRSLGEGRPFTLERFAVLLGDVKSIVAHAHARVLLDRLGQDKRVNAETRAWIEHNARVVEGCASSRFENRGGPGVFETAVGVVAKRRGELEPMLFQSAPAAPAAQASPTPQRKTRKKAE